MLSVHLMLECSRRQSGPDRTFRALLDDACVQASYCLDAPHVVQDGVEWYEDPQFDDIKGPVPRIVDVRGTDSNPQDPGA